MILSYIFGKSEFQPPKSNVITTRQEREALGNTDLETNPALGPTLRYGPRARLVPRSVFPMPPSPDA